ncbi:MMPL family transporter [Cohnella sp. CFH 77786]|uniref:MMPL family transporter n=1 Tax=Cohnella sp. CFH 77786 TaxID=2662265 RepID=UPI001C60E5F9|nr:MMPL family transporter [Cohnella sp. CFH 77786]MBW5446980.1 MMPL family transporter [Cohnella sp. CFH 77786]
MDKWIRWTSRLRWAFLALWIGLAAVSVAALPDLQEIVKKTEQKFLPSDAESLQAVKMLDRINPDSKSASNAVIVLSRDGGLRDSDKSWMNELLGKLEREKTQLGITGILSSETQPELKERFLSKDGTTMLAIVNLPYVDFEDATLTTLSKLKTMLKEAPEGARAELTGGAPISQEFQQSSQDGLKKTELLTVGLVLVILLIVFRSPIAPLIPLFTIGISLVISRGLIAAATDLGLPVSNFTESFLIAVLFGAGTDYCILLIQRFREELAKDGDRVRAMQRTMKGVGKTIAFSASTVFAAFFLIGFARFGLYQSAAGVAIGVVVTLIAGMTLAPALLLLLGRGAYWPMKVGSGHGHGESRLWGAAARLSAKRSGAVLLVVAIALAPLTLLFKGQRSFDDIAEIDPNLGSVVGFRQIEKSFGAGEVFPVSIAISSSASMRTPSALAALEQASVDVMKVPGVQEVRSAVRPLGRQLTELTVPDQLGKTSDAIGQLKDGVVQVGAGLEDAGKQLGSGRSDMDKLTGGLRDMAAKTEEARKGAGQLRGGLERSAAGASRIADGLKESSGAASSMKSDIDKLLKAHPELANDPNMLAIAAKQQALANGLKSLASGAAPLSQGLAGMIPALRQLGDGLGQLANGQLQAAQGVSSLQAGLGKLSDGLKQGADGLRQVGDGLGKVQTAQEGIAADGKTQIGGWVLPAEALNSDSFKQALDYYVSEDGKVTRFDVILKDNPYSGEAMDNVDEITSALRTSLGASVIADPQVYASGTSARYNELRDISFNDFVRTGLLVLAGIAVVLMLLLRSVLAPLYVLLSLGFNYLVTMGIVEFLFVKLLGYPGLSWTVSFFIFLILVALGVDYSIFLMARFKEEHRTGGVVAAMSKAMTTTGGVIVSAAVIMGGTFGALGFSGVVTLVQIGVGTLVGLLLYAVIFMALVVPSFSFLLGEANWWPFRRRDNEENPSASATATETL